MIYNHMPDEYYADKKISASSKLILQRLFTLSKDGTQTVFAQRQKLSEDLGLSLRTVTRSFKELLDNNYIEEVKNKDIFDRTKHFNLIGQNGYLDVAKMARFCSQNGHLDVAKMARSPIDRNNNIDRIERDRKTLSIPFDFNSIFSAMNEVKKEFTDYVFTDEEIRENAQSYLDKSQAYKLYRGEVTEQKLKLWLQKSIEYLQNKPQGGNKTSQIVEHGFEIDFEGAAERLDKFKQFLEENNNPIDVDCNVIDELENKNTPA